MYFANEMNNISKKEEAGGKLQNERSNDNRQKRVEETKMEDFMPFVHSGQFKF